MIIYYNGFAFQFIAVQNIFFRQSVAISAALEVVSEKLVCILLWVFKGNADECEIPVVNYVDLCAWHWSITLLVFSLKCLYILSCLFISFVL